MRASVGGSGSGDFSGRGDWSGWLQEQLLERRVVLLRGELDDALAGRVIAELLVLEGASPDPIVVQVDAGGGTLAAAFGVMDTIDGLNVPVEAICVGRAEGPAVGVVAVAPRRLAAPHARFRLEEPRSSVSGRARDLEGWAAAQQAQLEQFTRRLAAATGQPMEHLEADLVAGRWLNATDAVVYGLVDGLWRR